MHKDKSEEILHILLKIIILVAVGGSIALLVTKRDAGPAVAFDLLAYIISVTALVLATLQGITLTRQTRITRRAATKISDALEALEELVQADKKLSNAIRRDSELDQEIINALAEHGVGKTEEQRQEIARAVRRHVKK